MAELGYAVMFRNGEKFVGFDAYEILEQLRGGWNPDDPIELRMAFARRAGYREHEDFNKLATMSDEEFISALDDRGFWVMKRIPESVVRAHVAHGSELV